MRSTTPWSRRIALGAAALGLLAVSVAGCSSNADNASSTTTTPSAYANDDSLRLNQMQVIGSHNSYRQRMPAEATALLKNYIGDQVRSLDYEHPPLADQFGDQGIRQIELDVFADPQGGLYSTRHAASLINLPTEGPPELRQPGFKTFHIQEVDFATSCLTFVACLQQVKAYSDANPDHAPIMILVEAKDDPIPDPLNLDFTVPVRIGPPEFDALDAEIRSVFGPDDMVTPDDVRGDRATLEEAVLAGQWPTLGQSRGKVLFALDNSSKRADYTAGHPSLTGRVMFTNATPGEPEAAFVERNDPAGIEGEIQDLVRKGYVVRSRADADTEQARTGDTAMRDAAIASGAQWVSTDYVDPDPAMGTDYSVRFVDGTTVRCNPVNAPSTCTAADIERGRVSGG